jgi:hypothetical protein
MLHEGRHAAREATLLERESPVFLPRSIPTEGMKNFKEKDEHE